MQFRRVCFFLPSAHRDGAELSALECMDALSALGMRCHAVLPRTGPLLAELQARGIPYQIIPYQVWVEPPVPVTKRLLITLWNLVITSYAALLVGRWRCDLIITNTINICVGALVAKLWGLPHVWYIREFGSEDHGWRFHLGDRLALWIMNHFSQAGIAVSRAVAQKYQASLPRLTVHPVYQPITIKAPSRSGGGPVPRRSHLTCIMVGRLQEGKCQEDAIRAVGELRDQGTPVQLWLVGGGDHQYRSFLEQLVREWQVAEQVRFFGQVDNAFPYIQQADVLLLCSRCEAFARVVVEALKAGKPVIGARSGGTVEQIQDGFNGFLYAPRNYRELAEKIKFLHDHPQASRKMGRQGQEQALTTFTQERYAQELARILSQIRAAGS
jgi:glycosyltransferase involved in cell wall biosynthesis